MRHVSAAPLLALLCACAALAAPVDPPPAGAIFARSCSDCPTTHFCEYGFEGGAADAVACVPSASRHELYRRYSNPSCTDADALSKGATMQCAAGAGMFQGCDVSTGSLAPAGATSATGACSTADQKCCIPGAAFAQICQDGALQCKEGSAFALFITDGDHRPCNATSGEAGSGGTGSCTLAGAYAPSGVLAGNARLLCCGRLSPLNN